MNGGYGSLITITKINDVELVVNCDLIELVETTPDTTITMTTGRKVIIKESVEEVMERIVAYKKRLVH